MTKSQCPQKNGQATDSSAITHFSPEFPHLLFSVTEVAVLLGVSRRTVFLLLASGELKRRKVRRRTMIHRDDVVQFAGRG